jgi:hypothetical protein
VNRTECGSSRKRKRIECLRVQKENMGAVERGREREVYWKKLFPIKAAILVGELTAAFILNERSLFRAGLDPKVLAK